MRLHTGRLCLLAALLADIKAVRDSDEARNAREPKPPITDKKLK